MDHEDQVDHENQVEQENQIPCFKKFTLSELFYIINEFSPSCIVSEGGVKDFNEVYIGKLEGNVLVAVKRFSKLTWPDAQHFVVRILKRASSKFQTLLCFIDYQ